MSRVRAKKGEEHVGTIQGINSDGDDIIIKLYASGKEERVTRLVARYFDRSQKQVVEELVADWRSPKPSHGDDAWWDKLTEVIQDLYGPSGEPPWYLNFEEVENQKIWSFEQPPTRAYVDKFGPAYEKPYLLLPEEEESE